MIVRALIFSAAIFCASLTPNPTDAEEPVYAAKALGTIMPAGGKVVYYDRLRLLILDPRSSASSEWVAVALPEASSFDGRLICSADGKGICALALLKDGHKVLGLLDTANERLIATSVELDRVVAIASSDQVYISRTQPSEAQSIYRVDARTQEMTMTGVIRTGESFELLPIDGSLQPVFATNSDTVRFPDEPTAVRVVGGISSGRSLSAKNVFGANDLFQKYPDGLDRAVIWRRTYSRVATDKLGGAFDTFELQLPAQALPATENFKTDRAGHVLGLSATGETLGLETLCSNRSDDGSTKKSTKLLRTYPLFAEVKVVGDGLGDGFVVRVRRPGEKEVFDYVSFEQAASEKLGGAACSDVEAKIIENLSIPGATFPAGWIEEVRELTVSDGKTIHGVLFRQSESPITTLVIDVYGASGLLRTSLAAPNDFLQSNAMKGMAIFYPLLPGDGNLGWQSAESARSPNRAETVSALIDVVKLARNEFLEKDGKVVLRGGSAGAWLALKTSLTEPNLVDEVVAISAAYFFEGSDDVVRLADFFATSDSLTEQEVAHCSDTFFRLIHGTEDRITPIERTRRFAGMMSANHCKGALHMVVGGDHNLIDFWDVRMNPETNNILYWTHGLEP